MIPSGEISPAENDDECWVSFYTNINPGDIEIYITLTVNLYTYNNGTCIHLY